MNKKVINELYWIAEDLLAYTDLTGNGFDIDHAQPRLWKMQPILAKNDYPKIQRLYNELSELLEVAAFFDKEVFSEKVNELYEILSKLKNH